MASISPDQAASPRRAWLLAGLVALLAAIWSGWLPWLRWYLLLIVAYAIGDLLLFLVVPTNRRLELRISVALALIAAVVGGSIACGVLWAVDFITRTLPTAWQFNFGVSFLFAAILLVSKVLEHEARLHTAHERQVVELKFNALQAQIEPHFLYNTLGNVQQLVRTSPVEAERMLKSLVHYLQVAIPEVRSGRATVGQERGRAEAYLAIMRIRMTDRLQYEIQVPDELRSIPIPPLSLMTLVENAVKHGIDAKPEGGMLRIVGTLEKKRLLLRVTDNGAGFEIDAGGGTGLTNLRERLLTLYGDRASLVLAHAEPSGVEATMEIPID
ncbi:MAG: histidine kinase [Betaproteobacteria bacterium]|nr:histidine kinase [Betaproteobacteria bacterium]